MFIDLSSLSVGESVEIAAIYIEALNTSDQINENIDLKFQHKVINSDDPTNEYDLVTKKYVDNNINNGTIVKNNKNNNFNNNLLINIAIPIAAYDAANKMYVDTHNNIVYNNKENDMNGFVLRNIGNPIDSVDAVNKNYIDSDTTIVRNDKDNDFNNNKITGVNMLYVVRDPDASSDGSKLPWAVTRKAYVDNHTRICYNDQDNNMNGNKITNIGNPINDNDVVNKSYVDSRKQIIAIWAEENGTLDGNTFEWSWGNGATGSQYGYPMLSDGRIIRAGASINPNNNSATIQIFVNGTNKASFSKLYNQRTTVTIFSPPIDLTQGQFIALKTNSETGTQSQNLVTLWIEVDL